MSDTPREQDVMHARIRYLVAEQRGAITEALREMIADLAPPTSSRLGTLRSAVAWHERRQAPQERLNRLDAVLRQLYTRASDTSGDQLLYIRLRRMIWPQPNPEWLARERQCQQDLSEPLWAEIFARLQTDPSIQERWRDELRVQVAAAVLGLLTATVETDALVVTSTEPAAQGHANE